MVIAKCDALPEIQETSVDLFSASGKRPLFDPIIGGVSINHYRSLKERSIFILFDAKVQGIERGYTESSIGVGIRGSLEDPQVFIGTNLFYDFHYGPKNGPHQIGLGLEYFLPFIDVRLNFYFPVKKKSFILKDVIYDDYLGEYFVKVELAECVAKSADVEFGKIFCCGKDVVFYPFLGSYYLDFRHIGTAWGGVLGSRVDWCQTFFAEFQYYYDKFFRSQIGGKIGLHFLLGSCNKKSFIVKPIRRRNTFPLIKRLFFETNY